MVLERDFPPDERVENEINILVNNGFQIILACTSHLKELSIVNTGKLTIYRTPIPLWIYKSSALALLLPFYFHFWKKHLTRVLNETNPNVIHLHDLPLIKVCRQLSTKYNIPLVSDYHENRPEIMKMYNHINKFPGKILISIKQWLNYQKKYTPLTDKLILVTNEAKEYYIKEFNLPEDKITVLPNYVVLDRVLNLEEDPEIPEWVSEKFTLVYFGDTGLRRGIITILEAAVLLKNDSNIHFLIMGNSKEQHIIEEFKDRLDLQNVTLTGYIPVTKALNYIRHAKAGLCPFLRNIHHDTTYANKMFQYMTYGKPVIASNCTAQANLILKENCGLVFEAGNASQLCAAIQSLRDVETYNTLSKNALHCTLNKYNWGISGQKLIDLYTKL